jgi:ABC-type amino acid transport substrate-binding protein
MRSILAFLTASLVLLAPVAEAATLDRVKASGAFRIGYRADAPPFAYRNALGEAAGYAVELCRRVAVEVKAALELEALDVRYVPVTAENRFDMVEKGAVDILCGPTTVTLARRERVDFSLFTFVDGASVMFRIDGPGGFDELAGQKVGVRAGTTTESALRNTLAAMRIDAEVVAVESHPDGVARLTRGDVAAYFADRVILMDLLRGSGARNALRLSDRYFTHESYALALQRGDDDFRLLVDAVLSQVYRSGAIEDIFAASFGAGAEPSQVLVTLYLINGLP